MNACTYVYVHAGNCLVGLVVKVSAYRVEVPGFDPRLRSGDIPGRALSVT